MVFAIGGPAGIDELRGATFDVVVSDMRMPDVDGAALLLQVRDHDPTTFRMILSGFSDQNATTRALPLAHHFFDKPCDLKALADAIDRSCRLRTLFSDARLRAVVDHIASLGSPVGSPRSDDPGATARTLRLATSAFLGAEQPAASHPDPTSPSGQEMIAGQALASLAHDALARPIAGLSLDDVQRHSHEVAERAQRGLRDAAAASDAFTAGLVHEIGRLLIAIAMPEDHAAISRRLAQSGARRSVVERELLGTTHGEVGAYVLALWSIPLSVIEAVAFHDDELVPATPISSALRAAHV